MIKKKYLEKLAMTFIAWLASFNLFGRNEAAHLLMGPDEHSQADYFGIGSTITEVPTRSDNAV